MRHLGSRVPLEAKAGLIQQLGRHREITLSLQDPPVSEVRREVRKKALDVLALAVPGNQPHDRKCVSKVVQPWLETRRRRTTNTGFLTQSLKNKFGGLTSDAFEFLAWREAERSQSCALSATVGRYQSKDSMQIRSNRNEAALEEFGLANRKHTRGKIKVTEIKA